MTRDEERNLPRALASLPAGLRVLVLDAQSGDRTREIAREWGATVLERPWSGFVEARLFALAAVRTPWTLMLDADEWVDEALRAAILDAADDADGYELARDTYFCGRAMRMWKGERLVRLFRTGLGTLRAAPAGGGDAQLHERWNVAGPVGHLRGTLVHESYPDVAAYRRKFDAYTTIEARLAPASALGLAWQLCLAPARFLRALLGRGGLLDGWRGIFVAYYSAIYPVTVRAKARAGR
ncbi:MAG: glycosyltransferase family 2 protein [Vulcanimicrobiaceae bacterium]